MKRPDLFGFLALAALLLIVALGASGCASPGKRTQPAVILAQPAAQADALSIALANVDAALADLLTAGWPA